MRKKIFSFFLLGAMALSMSACSMPGTKLGSGEAGENAAAARSDIKKPANKKSIEN